MPDTTEIEKKSLEAHVELCAERYRHLETKLETVENKIIDLGNLIKELHDMISDLKDKRENQLIGWGTAIIVMLVAALGWFFVHFLA